MLRLLKRIAYTKEDSHHVLRLLKRMPTCAKVTTEDSQHVLRLLKRITNMC